MADVGRCREDVMAGRNKRWTKNLVWWPPEDVSSIACPWCKALAGEPCRGVIRRDGHRRDRVGLHRSRHLAYERRQAILTPQQVEEE